MQGRDDEWKKMKIKDQLKSNMDQYMDNNIKNEN